LKWSHGEIYVIKTGTPLERQRPAKRCGRDTGTPFA
jgi:hypothetical protein